LSRLTRPTPLRPKRKSIYFKHVNRIDTPVDDDVRVRSPLLTYDLLKALGFVVDKSVISDDPGGLSFDFGNLKLEASHLLNRKLVPVVSLGGNLSDGRTLAQIECEMPREVGNFEQGVALLTWCLDRQFNGEFRPLIPIHWIWDGRKNRHLLPWNRNPDVN